MSYLNSILSSIGGNEQAPRAPSAKPPSRTASPLNRPNGAPASRPPAAPTASAPASKRKAEDDDDQSCNSANKVLRRDTQALPDRLASAVTLSKPTTKPTTNGPSSAGSSRPNSAGGPTSAKPTIKTTTNAGIARPAAASASAGSAPKKGSFAETLARAAAAQKAGTAKPSLGTILHKPAEKLSAQEKKVRQEQLKNRKVGGKSGQPGSRPLSRSQSPEKSKPDMAAVPKQKKVPVDLGYKGTMRPSASTAPSYKGTMRGGPDPSKSQRRTEAQRSGYDSYSEDDYDEEQEDYDDLSDMEAGMDEMYDEEEASLKIARREDLEAKREEDRLKREKEQRKRLLQKR